MNKKEVTEAIKIYQKRYKDSLWLKNGFEWDLRGFYTLVYQSKALHELTEQDEVIYRYIEEETQEERYISKDDFAPFVKPETLDQALKNIHKIENQLLPTAEKEVERERKAVETLEKYLKFLEETGSSTDTEGKPEPKK